MTSNAINIKGGAARLVKYFKVCRAASLYSSGTTSSRAKRRICRQPAPPSFNFLARHPERSEGSAGNLVRHLLISWLVILSEAKDLPVILANNF
jgi:hypothetical protein